MELPAKYKYLTVLWIQIDSTRHCKLWLFSSDLANRGSYKYKQQVDSITNIFQALSLYQPIQTTLKLSKLLALWKSNSEIWRCKVDFYIASKLLLSFVKVKLVAA